MKRSTILFILFLGYNAFVGTFFIFHYKSWSKQVRVPTEARSTEYSYNTIQFLISEISDIAKNNPGASFEGMDATNGKLQHRDTFVNVMDKRNQEIYEVKKEKNHKDSYAVPKDVIRAFRSRQKVKDSDCLKIFKKDVNVTLLAKAVTRKEQLPNDYIRETKNCSRFIKKRGYIMDYLTDIEREFPIAFSILMFKAAEQSERLLRAIYRPQNFYCIHVDKKSDQIIYDAMESIANCFDNVFLTSTRYDVRWGTMTVLKPDLHCMSELQNRSKTWKYFINLTGQEFPLKTNLEMVKILQAYNGSSDMEGTRKRINKNRWERAGRPPHGIIPTKGSVHIVASRAFVEFIVNDQRAKDFLEWCKSVSVPDEVFFSSLQHNPHLGISGAYKGEPESFKAEDSTVKPFLARFKNWLYWPFGWPCFGKKVRQICIIGVEDLPLLYNRKELFVNKMHHDFQPIAYDCLEELHFNRTRDAYFGHMNFDVEWYKNLGFVKNRV